MSGNDQRSYNKRTWKCSFQREQLGSKLLWLFFFFKSLANHNKISFPFSNISHLLLSFFCSLLSLNAEPSEMLRISPHTFSRHPNTVSPPKISKTFTHTLSEMPFISFPPQYLHHLIFLSLYLWNPPPSAFKLQLIQLLLQSRGEQLPLINPPLLTRQESTWIQGGLQSTSKIVQIRLKTIL